MQHLRSTSWAFWALFVFPLLGFCGTAAQGQGFRRQIQRPTAFLGQPKNQSGSQDSSTKLSEGNFEKKYLFEMRDVPWNRVLEWLSDNSGIPIITRHRPTGTLNFIPPKTSGGPKKYTIPQIIDILNEALQAQKYVLIRRTASFTVWPADKKIPPEIVPQVEVKDLRKRGKTELVSLVLDLENLVAEDFAPEVKKMMGPFGEVVPLTRANQLWMQDKVGTLELILRTIKNIELREKGQTYSHQCKYIRAQIAEARIKELLGDPLEIIRRVERSTRGSDDAKTQIRMYQLTSDDRTNTVFISGPADKIAQAKQVLKQLDVPQPGQTPVVYGPPILKTYNLPTGNAEALATTLTEVYKDVRNLKISAVGQNQVMVWAGPEYQLKIAKHLLGANDPPPASKTESFSLATMDATRASQILKAMFGDPTKGGPFIDADTVRNAIIVKGRESQVNEVKAALRAIGESSLGGKGSKMRIITIGSGSAATLAEALGKILPKMRNNPVKVFRPGAEEEEAPKKLPPPQRPEYPPKKMEKIPEEPINFQKNQLVDPQDKKKLPGKGKQVNITAFGNRLIVTSDDPDALALTQELVRLFTQTQAGEGDFEIIRLKYADATEAAKILDEAFNGPQSRHGAGGRSGRGGGGFNPLGMLANFATGGATAPSDPRAERIRVVAYPATNSLLVKATPLDLLTIRNLLGRAIDQGESDSKALIRTHVIGPLKYASANEIADVIEDVYKESMTAKGRNQNDRPRFPFFMRRDNDSRNRTRNVGSDKILLTVGVDDRTNSLIVACPDALYQDIKSLVDQLETASRDSTRTVEIIRLKGIDPVLVQQAVEAIQGKTSTNGRTRGSGTSGGPTFRGGFSPFFRRPGSGSSPPSGRSSGRTSGNRGSGRSPRTSGQQQSRGPDFFVQPVKDDRSTTSSALFDPQAEKAKPKIPSASPRQLPPTVRTVTFGQQNKLAPVEEKQPLQFVSYQEPQGLKKQPEIKSNPIRGPRSDVNAEALEELGIIVISGNNKADVLEVIRIIEYLQKLGAGAEIEIELVPMQHADATSVSKTLTLLFQQVVVGATSTTPGTVPTTGQATTTGQASVVLLPIPRLNSILLAAPTARVADIKKEISRLDVPYTKQAQATPFPLKNAAAARVASLISGFYAQRFPNEATEENQIRITSDDKTNTVFVQAAPADMAEIRNLIWRLDNTVSKAVNQLKIIPVNNALAEELAVLISQAISDQVATPSGTAAGVFPTQPGGGTPRGLGQAGPPGGVLSALGAQGGTTGTAGTAGTTTKVSSLRFFSHAKKKTLQSGLLDDIRITADPRSNSLIISAPEKTMNLLEALIKDLDTPPAARSEINIFTLEKADAAAVTILLQQLFLGTSGGIPGQTGTVPVQPGAGVPGVGLGGRPLQLSVGGQTPQGAPLIDLRITLDERTNSIIVAGSQNDLDVIEAIISRLEDSEVQSRRNEVYRLKNAIAADVAAALNDFLVRSLTVYAAGNQLTPFQQIQREVVIVREPISNTLLVSATPKYFGDIINLIIQLDQLPPQVLIQALIAEVTLNDTDEFGVELGFQSPILFDRSVIPGGAVVNNITTSAVPGFNFNTTAPLSSATLAAPGRVGLQGLGNFGTGRISPNSAVGGFIFSAASDSVNILVRALRTQGRLDILSRPQVMTADNQAARILVGQSFPFIVNSIVSTAVTGVPTVTNSINYRDIGVELFVTPKINPDGTVIMRVVPSVSSTAETTVQISEGVFATAFNVQTVETTVISHDGETVAIGGLIQRSNRKEENKIPWLGDLPGVGALFRFREQVKSKTELLVILTPHIVRCQADADRLLAEESTRIDWIPRDVLETHAGPKGIPPIMNRFGPGGCNCGPGFSLPGQNPVLPMNPQPTVEPLPSPRKIPEPPPTKEEGMVLPDAPVIHNDVQMPKSFQQSPVQPVSNAPNQSPAKEWQTVPLQIPRNTNRTPVPAQLSLQPSHQGGETRQWNPQGKN